MSSGDDTGERNPFAPPPADAPDQPWQPRAPQPPAPSADQADGDDEQPQVPPPHPWSPGYQGGWSAPQPTPKPKFDPTDPVQRRARYALSAGMAGLLCLISGIAYVSLLLGALAVYWGISSLRAPRPGSKPADSKSAASKSAGSKSAGSSSTGAQPAYQQSVRPQTPAAVGGLVTGGAAALLVLASLSVNVFYADYVNCVNDAVTAEAQQGCSNLGPKFLVDIYNNNQ